MRMAGILNRFKVRLRRDVSAGAVYATLERLESKALATSRLAPGTAIRGGERGATSFRLERAFVR